MRDGMNWPYVFAELTRRPARTIAAALAIAIGVAMFVSLQAYADGYRQAARAPLDQIGADVIAQRQGAVPNAFEGIVFPHSTAPIHQDEIGRIRALPGVTDVGQAVLFWDFEKDRFLVGLGFDPGQAVGPGRLRAGILAGRFLQPGDHSVAVVDTTYASANKLALGNTVDVAGQPFQVVGLVDTSRAGQVANANLYVPLADAQALATKAPNVQAVFAFRPDDANVLFIQADAALAPAIAGQVKTLLGDQAIVTTPASFEQVLGPSFALINRFGLFVGLAALVVATAGLLRTTAAGLWERRRDIGLMRAVGWRRREVVSQLLTETLTLTALGAVIGLGLAAIVARGLGFTHVTIPVPWELSPSPHFLPQGASAFAVTVPLAAPMSAAVALGALALALLCGGLTSFFLARRAADIKPAEAFRNE
ncbi:MAG: ABC transporter permease [Chloroflexota bacterium]|nr:ABC transporter permease [Chloroflexota bacterium]